MIHKIKSFEDLVKIVKKILKNNESGFPVEIWDGRILEFNAEILEINEHTEDISSIVCERELSANISKLLVDEKPFEVFVKFIRHPFVKTVSLKLTFGEIRNFIGNIVIASVHNACPILDNEFRILVRKTFPEKFKSINVINPIIDYIAENLDDEGTDDKLFRYKIKELCS